MEQQELPPYRRRIGVVLIVLGIVSSSLAGVGLLRPVLRQETITVEAAASQAEPKEQAAVGSASSVFVESLAYDPGADSGWNSHPGVHAVLILSGTLELSLPHNHRHTAPRRTRGSS